MLRIKLVKSSIGCKPKNRATIQALGLNKLQAEVVKEDNACLRGQIHKVKEMLLITDETTGAVIHDGRTKGPRTRKSKKPPEYH